MKLPWSPARRGDAVASTQMASRTAGIVAKELKALGFQVQTGIGKTGVVAILRNGVAPTVVRVGQPAEEPILGAQGMVKVRGSLPLIIVRRRAHA